MAKLRTFIAVEATPEIKARAVELIRSLASTPANVKWVDEENMHWTLKFLGDVDSNDIPDVCRAVTAAVERVPAFDVVASGAGAFPNVQRPRTLWLGVADGEDEFVAVHDAVERSLQPLGFRSEHRRFNPHLTIGRVRRSPNGVAELGDLVTRQAEFAAGQMRVSELVVFASRLRREGPSYQALGRIPLG